MKYWLFSFFLAITNVHAQTLEDRVRGLFVTSNVPSPYAYGGYVMFHQEMDNNLCSLKKEKFPDALLMVDHEGGTVNRLKSKLPAASEAYKTSNYLELWKKDAEILKSKCFDVVLGPTLDVALETRSYSSSLEKNLIIGKKVSTIIEKHQLIPTYKHFPGRFNNCQSVYTKKEIQVCPQGLEEIYEQWKHFKNNDAPLLMMSNNIYKGYSPIPAVIDKKYYQYLRQELNYQGAIITDALWEMSAPLTNNTVWEIFKNADLLMIMNPKDAERFLPFLVEKIQLEPNMLKNLDIKEARIRKIKNILSR